MNTRTMTKTQGLVAEWAAIRPQLTPGEEDLFSRLTVPQAAGAVIWLSGGCIYQAMETALVAYARAGSTRLGFWRSIINTLKEAKADE